MRAGAGEDAEDPGGSSGVAAKLIAVTRAITGQSNAAARRFRKFISPVVFRAGYVVRAVKH